MFSHERRKQVLTLQKHLLSAWFITVLPLHYLLSFIALFKILYDVIENKVLFQNANSSVSLFCFEVNIADDVLAFSRFKLLANV